MQKTGSGKYSVKPEPVQDYTTGQKRSVSSLRKRMQRRRALMKKHPPKHDLIPKEGLSFTPPPPKPKPEKVEVPQKQLTRTALCGGYWECMGCSAIHAGYALPCKSCNISASLRYISSESMSKRKYRCTYCRNKYETWHEKCPNCSSTYIINELDSVKKPSAVEISPFYSHCNIRFRNDKHQCPVCQKDMRDPPTAITTEDKEA